MTATSPPAAPPAPWPEMRALVPHSAAMVLLDRVIAADDESLCAEVRIGAGSVFCGADGVGAWVGIEYMAQAIAAHAGWLALQRGEALKVGFLLGARKYAAHTDVFAIGSVLRVSVRRLLQADNGLGAFECIIAAADDGDGGGDDNHAALATATVTVFQPDNVNQFLQDGSMV